MNPLHDYVAMRLAEKLKSRKLVVWYDPRREFAQFVHEVRGEARMLNSAVTVMVSGVPTRLAEYAGSMFELRNIVEPHVSAEVPGDVVLYVPGGERDHHGSVLMELEQAGTTWEPQLKQLARNVLLQKYTVGVVDEMLPFDRAVTYEDVARAASATGAEPPSALKSIFHDVPGHDGLLAAWLSSDARDAEIVAKNAAGELVKLVRSRLGLELNDGASLMKLRAIAARYVLAGEFRTDLTVTPPSNLQGVPAPGKKDEAALRAVARTMRSDFAAAYPALADSVEGELGLRSAGVPADGLGAIDTFRFEEATLLAHCNELVVDRQFDQAIILIREREHSFWLDRDVSRKAQWEVCRRMAELGIAAASVRAEVGKANGDPAKWIEAYAANAGWHRLDQAQRRLEAWVAKLDDEPDERALGVVRRAYENCCNEMAEGFTKALVKASWAVAKPMPQTRVYTEVVADRPKPVAYFLVDAMRFEMGTELSGRLPHGAEISLRPAIAALPSITPIGMAALQPAASSSFSVSEQSGKLGARIDDVFLPDVVARRKFAAARVPKLVDLTLDELLSLQPSKLSKRVDGAPLVIVRSQEIDHAGEAGFAFQARLIMDTVIDNVARSIRKLSAAGIENFVVAADHGHLFFASDRDESMRVDPPGGDEVDLHRRCWIGRGGATPANCVRVSASALGYASDLDFVFPAGCGVFRAGGDLAYLHGGPSLQELVVPVLAIRLKRREPPKGKPEVVAATGLPDAVTNRIFSITLQAGGQTPSLLSGPIVVRPLLMAEGKQVGAVGMAVDAELDPATGCVTLQPGKPATVALLLADAAARSVAVVIQDPATDAELYRSPTAIPVRLGV
jgi:PglZ domain-containing protein